MTRETILRALSRWFNPRRQSTARPHLAVEALEDRTVPAVFNIANGDVAGLIAALKTANINNQADTINLAAGGIYTVKGVNDTSIGATGLPSILFDGSTANTLTIHGNGATIQRQAGADPFRLLLVDGGSVTLDHVTLLNGQTVTGGGFDSGTSDGGAILVEDGTLTLLNSTLAVNAAVGPLNSSGGAIAVEGGEADLTACTFTGNAASYGGAVAILGATANLTGCTIADNTANVGGGGLFNLEGVVHIEQSTIQGNTDTAAANTVTSNDTPFGGGGIANQGVLTLDASTVSGNTASTRGGGIQNLQGFAESINGIPQPPAVTLTITNSTIGGNTATDPVHGIGGGIDNVFAIATLTDSTIANNFAGEFAGGISNEIIGSQVTLISCTVTGNTAGSAIGGILNDSTVDGVGTCTLHDTLIAANTSPAGTDDVFGAFVSQGYNLIGANPNGNASGFGSTDLVNVNPKLGPLQNNGGPTATVALLAGSRGIDEGNPNFKSPPATDQRGFNRVVNGRIDIGAFELQRPSTTTLIVSPTPAGDGLPVTLTVTVRGSIPGQAGVVPTGSVTFLDGTTVLGTVNLNGGQASFITTLVELRIHDLTAVYNGDANFQASTSADTPLPVERPAQVALTATAGTPSVLGQPITLTVAVSQATELGLGLPVPKGGLPVPSGTVIIWDGAIRVATLSLQNGQASVTLSTLAPGPHSFTASYSGDGTYGAANSGTVSEVLPGPKDVTRLIHVARIANHFGNPLRQTFVLKNVSGQLVQGPLYLVLDGLTRGVKLRNATGFTRAHLHLGDPFVMLPVTHLRPGQTFKLNLVFVGPKNAPINFTPLVLAGLGVV
jgi:hypothetical protein